MCIRDSYCAVRSILFKLTKGDAPDISQMNARVRELLELSLIHICISYKKLWMLLLERDIKKASLRHEIGLSAGTWTKLNLSLIHI